METSDARIASPEPGRSPGSEQGSLSLRALQQQIGEIDRGVRLFFLMLLLLTIPPNVAIVLSIRPAIGLLTTLFPTRDLPLVTQWMLNHPIYFMVACSLGPVFGAALTWRARRPLPALSACCGFLAVAVGQFTLSWIALFLPFRALIAFISGTEE
jgi:hypothetical protein